MKAALLVFALALFTLCIGQAAALGIDYQIIIEDNGNSIVIMTINSDGVVSVPLPGDVEEVMVKGALYLMNDSGVEISMGSIEEAILLYTTSLLTSKNGSEWAFELTLAEAGNVTIAMPENTMVLDTEPQALMESGEFLQLHWENASQVSLSYYFDGPGPGALEESGPGVTGNMPADPTWIALPGAGIIAALGAVLYFRRPRMSKKQSIIKIMSPNDRKIVKLLMENKGEIKRSVLEGRSGISKSSLSASLQNLERKKIVEVDRTFYSHHVRFTRWFNEL